MDIIAEQEDTRLSIDGARLTPALRARACVLLLWRDKSVLDSFKKLHVKLDRGTVKGT